MAEAQSGQSFLDYATLHKWSVEHSADFWSLCAQFTGIRFSTTPVQIKGPDKMPGTRWFEGAYLNFAEHLLRRSDQQIALAYRTETGESRDITYAELHHHVAQAISGLHRLGIKPGDRVAGYLVNGPEAIISFLACAASGAVWTACSPDFGPAAVLDRIKQLEPTILIASEKYVYGGKVFDRRKAIEAIEDAIPSLQATIIVPFADEQTHQLKSTWITWNDLTADSPSDRTEFVQLPFDHPIYVLFSSGTTGKPKCLVHGAGGVLLQHRKEHMLHTDLRSDDVLLYLTTCGWMMWNWMVSALATGCTIVLYEGNAMHPDAGAAWRLASDCRVTVFGTSAAHIDACRRTPTIPSRETDLRSLRVLLSTGSVLATAGFRWIHDHVNPKARLSSISGGTDLVSCFVLGNPLLPVQSGEIQCAGLGMDVAALNSEGKPVIDETGELVCRSPFPSMPLRLWHDPEGTAYEAAYFDKFPGVWTHGDLIRFTASGSAVIDGRSDTTLNPGGVRIGTAEIYRALDGVDGIAGALAAALRQDEREEIVLFVVLEPEVELNEHLKNRIGDAIRAAASPRHTPRHIVAVADLPQTRNGKLAELSVARILRGESVPNIHSLANPEVLEEFASARDALLMKRSDA